MCISPEELGDQTRLKRLAGTVKGQLVKVEKVRRAQ